MKHLAAKRQDGVAIVEFALVLPILLLLTFLVFEFGRAVLYYGTIARTTREAARYLSVHTPGTALAEARNIVIYGRPNGSGTPVVPGLSASQIEEQWDTEGTDPVVGLITVRVTGYQFTPIFVGSMTGGLGNVTFSDIQSTMRSPNIAAGAP